MMMRWIQGAVAPLAVAVMMASVTVAQTGDPAARELVQQAMDSAPTTPFTAKATLSSTTRGWERNLELTFKRVDGVDSSYMEVTAPMDVKDTRFLLLDRKEGADQQFIYVPALKRSIQVGEQTRKQPFLGSDFSVADMVRPDPGAYSHTLVGEETIGGRACKLVESIPTNPADAVYGKVVFAVDPADKVVVRSQFFDAKGQLLKVWTIEDLQKIDGIWTPKVQIMENVQDHTSSKLEITAITYNAPVSDETFRKAYLTR